MLIRHFFLKTLEEVNNNLRKNDKQNRINFSYEMLFNSVDEDEEYLEETELLNDDGSINENKLNLLLDCIEKIVTTYSPSKKLYIKPVHVDEHLLSIFLYFFYYYKKSSHIFILWPQIITNYYFITTNHHTKYLDDYLLLQTRINLITANHYKVIILLVLIITHNFHDIKTSHTIFLHDYFVITLIYNFYYYKSSQVIIEMTS